MVILALQLVTISLALDKSLSDGMHMAVIPRYFSTNLGRGEHQFLLNLLNHSK